jgi:hypothetical protein
MMVMDLLHLMLHAQMLLKQFMIVQPHNANKTQFGQLIQSQLRPIPKVLLQEQVVNLK